MLMSLFGDLGAWNWVILGLVLLVAEVLAPGVFLLWIGIAALIVGGLSLLVWDAGFWTWHVQVLVFLALSVATVLIGKRLIGGNGAPSDQPLLNRRAQQFVGRIATLSEPIRNGRGRLQLDDTVWRVSGPDLAAGSQVRVAAVGASDLELVVEAV